MESKSCVGKGLRWLSPLFPIVVAAASFIAMKSGCASEFCMTLMLVSFVSVTAVPFLCSMVSISGHNPSARKAALLASLSIWLVFTILSMIFPRTSLKETSLFSLTLLACVAINYLPVWAQLFFCGNGDSSGCGAKEVAYWSWPMVLPLLFAASIAIAPSVDTDAGAFFHNLVPALLVAMCLSFVIYLILYVVRKLKK